VLGWVFGKIGEEGKAQAQADCDAQLAAMAAPATVSPPLPWNTSAPAPETSG